MAKGSLGELEIELNGEKHTLTPEFVALAEMQDRTGLTNFQLCQLVVHQKCGLRVDDKIT